MRFTQIEVGHGTGCCALCHERPRAHMLEVLEGPARQLFEDRGIPLVLQICDRCRAFLSDMREMGDGGRYVAAGLDFLNGPIGWSGVESAIRASQDERYLTWEELAAEMKAEFERRDREKK